jgi:hypothetical protein
VALFQLSQTLQGPADGKERSRPRAGGTDGVMTVAIKIVVFIVTLVGGFFFGLWITQEKKL